MFRVLFFFLSCAIFLRPTYGGETPAGQFLLLETSVREDGLGGGGAALGGEPDSLFGNPAGLAGLENPEVLVGGFVRPTDDGSVAMTQFGAIYPTQTGFVAALGGSFMRLAIPGFDASGNPAAESTERNIGLRFAGAWKREAVALGFRVKRLATRLNTSSRERTLSVLGGDLGALFELGDSKRWALGLAAENLGAAADGFAAPVLIRGGLALRTLPSRRLHFALDGLRRVASERSEGALGIEYAGKRYSFRAGGKVADLGNAGLQWTPSIGGTTKTERFTLGLSFSFVADATDTIFSRAYIAYQFLKPNRIPRGPGRKIAVPKKRVRRSVLEDVAVFEFDRVNLIGKRRKTVDRELARIFRKSLGRNRRLRIAGLGLMERRLGKGKSQGAPCVRGEARCWQAIGAKLGIKRLIIGEILYNENIFRLRADLIATHPYRVLSTQDISGTTMSDLRRASRVIASQFSTILGEAP